MKKNYVYALMSAIALTGAVGLTSCTDSEDVVQNPNYDPETNSVLTQFVFNVSTSNQTNTRQSAAATQAYNSETTPFRGIQDAYLYPYTLTADATNTHLYDISTEAKALASREYDFSSLLSENDLSDALSKRVLELSLPVGTNAMLFYGRATKNSSTYSANVHGKVDYSPNKNAQQTSFSLVSRLQNTTSCNQTFDLYQCILNDITHAGLQEETVGTSGAVKTRDIRYAFWWPVDNTSNQFVTRVDNDPEKAPLYDNEHVGTATDAVGESTEDHSGYTFYMGSISWKDYGDGYAHNHDNETNNDVEQKALEEILGNAYHTFTTINPKELRSGSSAALLYTLQDLHAVTSKVERANPTNIPEYIAKLVSLEIHKRVGYYFDISTTEGQDPTLTWKSLDDLKTSVKDHYYNKNSSSFAAITGDISNFPANLDMPLGSALMTFKSDTQEWSYFSQIPNYDMGGNAESYTTLDKYNYPAEILYYGNSPLRVSDDPHETSQYPTTVALWDTPNSWGNEWTGNAAVKSTTRSVAMQKDINYGSALLKTRVGFAAGVEYLYDNNTAFNPTEKNKAIAAVTGNFELTGILVAGQPKTVGWDFTAKKYNNAYHFDDMVFDNQIVDKKIPTTIDNETPGDDKSTYTLVWDTYNPSATDSQNQVYVALEFKNTSGTNFWGLSNVIRNGGTFYIIGSLDPSSYIFPSRTNTNYNLPPFNTTTGATIETPRVFMQDFVTVANFVLGANSLKHAYVTVPDLRSSQISLGLSVDLKWETGLTFGNVLLGGPDNSENP